MASKKAQKGVESGKSGDTMSSDDVKKFSKLLKDIGEHKREGFIFIVTTDGESSKDGKTKTAEGILFGHRAPRLETVSNLLDRMDFTPREFMALYLSLK